jgi:GrpB-like predicted nucleotidyltransferase (UPF0157 family)
MSYVVEIAPAEQFALLFRDYLRALAEEARRYESLKY